MSSFPLLRLPSKELSKVLRHMDPISQLGFSLLSEKSKNRISLLRIFSGVISINVCGYKSHITLTSSLRNSMSVLIVHILGPDIYIYHSANWRDTTRLSFRREMSLRQWIDHFLKLTSAKNIYDLVLSSLEKIHKSDLKGLNRSLTGLPIRNCTYHRPNIGFSGTLPIVNQLTFLGCSQTLTSGIHEIIVQNHSRFTYFIQRVASFELNHMLASNTSFLQSATNNLPDAQLNLFLKHWIAGSNHRFLGFSLTKYRGSYNKDVVLKGINYRVAEEREVPNALIEEAFLPLSENGMVTKFDITSSSEVHATIYFGKGLWTHHRRTDDKCCMLVWE